MKLNNSLTGRNKVTCPFELELESILGERKSLNPDYVLDSENADGKDGNNLNINEDSGDIDIPSCSNAAFKKDVPLCTKPSLKKENANPKQRTVKLLEEIVEERKNFHSAVLRHMEARDRRNERKMDLLEKIAAHICNTRD
ncbi:uncharacterized protein LOC105261778 [Musca domestica]|uniref:Uncharacterized protein LOC105261778 isoform X1 n=1 Tax=Musca domestica TaxID=7370 RepID=A0A1I8NJP9_MUSDO|nr:uncharacterized protein LOC105261778 [Musca domestica]